MGAYKNIPKPIGHDYYSAGDLYVRPCDFAAAFPAFYLVVPGDGKVTRMYGFEDISGRQPAHHFCVFDLKRTSLYDAGMPEPGAFWSSQEYVALNIEMNAAARRDDWAQLDFRHWIYAVINHAILDRLK